MQLEHIDLKKLKTTAVNMRHGAKAPDVTDILPSIRARGIVVPLIVRANGDAGTFEVVAGERRLTAAQIIAKEAGEIDPLPCAIIDKGDDAAAIEISILENCARLAPDPMTQFEAFASLAKEGRSVMDIADTFGVTELTVKRRLALGNLIAPIRKAVKAEDIDHESTKLLTMASPKQQREWVKFYKDKEAATPLGHRLKSWLFGGQQVATKVALFDLKLYKGTIIGDLFGEDEYFSDADTFWTLQNKVIAEKKTAFEEAGWQTVHVMDIGKRFYEWDYEETAKDKGGQVYIQVAQSGEVRFFEGYITEKEARARARAASTSDGGTPKAARAEISKTLQNYLALHRHAAVQNELAGTPALALRVTVAHMIVGTHKWSIHTDGPRPKNESIGTSIKNAFAKSDLADRRKQVLKLLDLPTHNHTVSRKSPDAVETAEILAHLLTLSDAEVMDVMAYVMAETLAGDTPLVEAIGNQLAVDMTKYWQPEQAFFDLLREKPTINAILKELGGKSVADGNVSATGKAQKAIIADFLEGRQGRKKISGWMPRFMQFPFKSYTKSGGIGIEDCWQEIAKYFKTAPSKSAKPKAKSARTPKAVAPSKKAA